MRMFFILMPLAILLTLIFVVAVSLDRFLSLVHRRNALPGIRRVVHRFRARRRRGFLFFTGYALFTIAVLAWAIGGLLPIVARSVPWVHASLHRLGGTVQPFEIHAKGVAFDRQELTLRAGHSEVVGFYNDAKTAGIPHNFSVFREGSSERLFQGDLVRTRAFLVEGESKTLGREVDPFGPQVRLGHDGISVEPAHAFYVLKPLPPGDYLFACDIYPRQMRGVIRVVQSPPVHMIDGPGWPDWARRIAEASHGTEPGWQVAMDYFFTLLNLVLGFLLLKLRPHDRVARFFAVAMLGTAAAYNLQSHASLGVLTAGRGIHAWIHPLSAIPYVFAVALFPDGKFVPRLRRRSMRFFLYGASTFALLMLSGVALNAKPDLGHMIVFLNFFGILIPVVGFLAQGYRARNAPTREARQQSRLLIWALIPAFVLGVAFVILTAAQTPDRYGQVTYELVRIVFRSLQPVFALIPVALFIGLVRYRLWDVDLVVSKTLVYSSLAVFIGAVYVAIVVGIGDALGGRAREPNTALAIAATAIVAVAIEPVRERARRVADRLVYGGRASPYEVMARFTHQMAGSLSVEEVLPRMAEAAANGVRAARARVLVFLPDGGERAADWPADGTESPAADRTVLVTHQGETVGSIAVTKPPGDPITHAEGRLLASLASQAGLALHSVRLAAELRVRLDQLQQQAADLAASRARIVSAQDAERRRLEREISERVERDLEAIAVLLSTADGSLAADTAAGIAVLDNVSARATVALETLRELARGVFPALLADHGLVAALNAQARKCSTPPDVHVAAGLVETRFDHHAETAVYFCCAEALAGAARQDGASLEIRLGIQDTWVTFAFHERQDDEGGARAPMDRRVLGDPLALQRMSDRVEALGGTIASDRDTHGATVISGRVPMHPQALIPA